MSLPVQQPNLAAAELATTSRLFTEKQIGVSALLGGPIPPGILFYLNYKRIDKEKEANISLAATLIFSIGLFYTMMKLPEEVLDKIPNAAITAFYGALVYIAYRTFLAREIESRLKDGNQTASNWAVAGVTVIGLVLNVAIVFALALGEPAFDGEKVTFGPVGHEIYFDESKTSRVDVDKLYTGLTTAGWCTEEFAIAAHLETSPEGYVVTLQADKQYWSDAEFISFISTMKVDLGALLHKDVTIVLEHYDLSGKTLRKTI